MHQKNKKFLTGLIAVLLATGLYMGFNSDSTLFTGYLAVEDRTIDGEEKSVRTFLDGAINADTWGELTEEDINNIYISLNSNLLINQKHNKLLFPVETFNEVNNNNMVLRQLEDDRTNYINNYENSIARAGQILVPQGGLENLENNDQLLPLKVVNNTFQANKDQILTLMPVVKGDFVDYFDISNQSEYKNDWYTCDDQAQRNMLTAQDTFKSLIELYVDRKNRSAHEYVLRFIQKIRENTRNRTLQNAPFKSFVLDLDDQSIDFFTYEDIQKLWYISSQINANLLTQKDADGNNICTEINIFNIFDIFTNPSFIEAIAYENVIQQDNFEIQELDLENRKHLNEYTFIDIDPNTISGVNQNTLEVLNILQEQDQIEPVPFQVIYISSQEEEPISIDYQDPSPFSFNIKTDQNQIKHATFVIESGAETHEEILESIRNLENNYSRILEEVLPIYVNQTPSNQQTPLPLGFDTTLSRVIHSNGTINGLENNLVTWDKQCITNSGLSTCPIDKNIILLTLVESKTSEEDSNFIPLEKIIEFIESDNEQSDLAPLLEENNINPLRFSFILTLITNNTSTANEIATRIDLNTQVIISPSSLDENGATTVLPGDEVTITVQNIQGNLPTENGAVKLAFKDENGNQSILDCLYTQANNRLQCVGVTPQTAGEYNLWLQVREEESLITRDEFERIIVQGQNQGATGNSGGNTGAGNGDGGTQAGETAGNPVTASPIQEGQVTGGSNMTLEVPLTGAQSTNLGINQNSTVQVRLVDSNGSTQATLTCTQTNNGLNCTGQAPSQGQYSVVVVVNNNGTITTHTLQETVNGQTTNQRIEIQAPELEITTQNSQEVELHNAEITLRGSQLSNLSEDDLTLVPTNNTLTSSDNNAEVLNPTNIRVNQQGTEAILEFGDVFPGNYQLKHNDEVKISNVVVINPTIASPSQGATNVALKPEIAFGSLYTLTNSYRIEISTGGQNIYTKTLTANSQTDVITHVVENELNPGNTYTLNVLPLFNQSPVANMYNSVQFTTTAQAPITNEQIRSLVLTCDPSEIYTETTANCHFNLPTNATLAAGSKMRFQGSTEETVVTIEGSRVDAALKAPATPGNYYIEIVRPDGISGYINQQITVTVFGDQPANPTDPANPSDPANPTDPTDPATKTAEDYLNISRDKNIDAGESMDLKVKLAEDSDFNLAVVTLYKIDEEDDEAEQIATLYYHCAESIEDDIDCPEYEEENLSGKKTLNINYDTSSLEAGNYIIQVYTATDAGKTYVLEKSLKVKSNQVVPGLPVQPGLITQCNQFFADMAPNDPQCYDVQFLKQYGLFNGQNINGMPVAQLQQAISRAEMFAILGKLYGFNQNYVNLQELAGYYTDISEQDAANPINQWWMVPLYHLTANQIITGYADGTIKASQSPTMAEFAKAIGQAVGFTTYIDTSKNPWYTDLVNTYYAYGVRFQPDMGTNRRGAVQLLSRTLQIIQNPSLNASYNPYQSTGLGYSAAYQAVPGGYNYGAYASNGYGVGTFNNQMQTNYNQNGYQGMYSAGSYGNMQQMGYGAYGYAPYSQYQMTGF